MPDRIIKGVRPCVADQLQPSGNGVLISVATAGVVRLVMDDNSRLDIYANIGAAELNNYAVKGYLSNGTTATVTAVSIF